MLYLWRRGCQSLEQGLPEAFLPADTLVEPKIVIQNKCNEDTGQQWEAQNSQLDCSPKWFLSAVIHHWHCMADHDVPEEDNPDGDKPVEGEEEGAQDGSEEAESFGKTVSAKDREGGGEDE